MGPRFRLACASFVVFSIVARAAIVTTTITGTLASGTDFTGVFGFAPGADLSGQPYTLIFTFDDAKGTQTYPNASCPGPDGDSGIMSTSTSNPGTAVLKIGKGSWTFGSLSAPFANSAETRAVLSQTVAGQQFIEVTAYDSDNQSNTDGVFETIGPAMGTILTTDCNWETAFSNSNVAQNPNSSNDFSIAFSGASAQGTLNPTTITVSGPHPAFFTGEDFLSGSIYYLQFPNGNLFGYYGYLSNSILYQLDLGYEAFIASTGGQIYFYDFASQDWWYTSSTLFPYLYDFTLNTFIYYFPDTKNTGHYTTNPRYFSNLTTNKIFTM